MFTISLNNLYFHAFHGVHDEEKVLGNKFEVNVELSIAVGDKPITDIEQTVNYAHVYKIIRQCMRETTALLETLAQKLTEKIHEYDNRINAISVSITKKIPPLSNMEGSVSVHYKKEF